MFPQRPCDHVFELSVAELSGRNVNGDADVFHAGVVPCADLAADSFDDPGPQRLDQTVFFGDRNKLQGRDHPSGRRNPAQQSFGSDNSSAAQVDLGLVMQKKFLPLQGMSQFRLHFQAPAYLGIEFGGTVTELVSAPFLGQTDGRLRPPQQVQDRCAILGENADADARPNVHLELVAKDEGSIQNRQEIAGHAFRIGAVQNSLHQQGELISGQARQNIFAAHLPLHPLNQ